MRTATVRLNAATSDVAIGPASANVASNMVVVAFGLSIMVDVATTITFESDGAADTWLDEWPFSASGGAIEGPDQDDEGADIELFRSLPGEGIVVTSSVNPTAGHVRMKYRLVKSPS